MTTDSSEDIIHMSADIVAAYVANNQVPVETIPELIRSVHRTMATLDAPDEAPVEQKEPAVSIRRSIQPDYIVCLEDGKRLTMLKRHLRARYDMSPEAYRRKWGLPSDYPMTAPNYAKRRSEIAKGMGLGTFRS